MEEQRRVEEVAWYQEQVRVKQERWEEEASTESAQQLLRSDTACKYVWRQRGGG